MFLWLLNVLRTWLVLVPRPQTPCPLHYVMAQVKFEPLHNYSQGKFLLQYCSKSRGIIL